MSSEARLDFSVDHPQSYSSPWEGEQRVLTYAGRCESCGIRTYGFSDGRNDPRGPLGEHASHNMEASDHFMAGPQVVACFSCMNDQQRYHSLLAVGMRRWKKTDR